MTGSPHILCVQRQNTSSDLSIGIGLGIPQSRRFETDITSEKVTALLA